MAGGSVTLRPLKQRREQLQAKATEIQEELRRWVKKVSILQPGEQIFFAIEVKKYPVVISSLLIPRTDTNSRIRARAIADALTDLDWLAIFQLRWNERDRSMLG